VYKKNQRNPPNPKQNKKKNQQTKKKQKPNNKQNKKETRLFRAHLPLCNRVYGSVLAFASCSYTNVTAFPPRYRELPCNGAFALSRIRSLPGGSGARAMSVLSSLSRDVPGQEPCPFDRKTHRLFAYSF